MKIKQLPPPSAAARFQNKTGKSRRIELSILFIFLSLMMIGEVKGQLQTFLNNMTPGTTYQSIKTKMVHYLDSLILVMDSTAYYSGAGEFKQFKKFSKLWEPRLGTDGTFESFYEAQRMYYNNLSSNFDYITTNDWHELGPNKLNYVLGRTGIGPVEAITFFDNGTPESTRYMLASSLMGGLFYSEDSGNSWKSGGTDSWVQSGCGWAVFHPIDHKIWYASSSGNNKGGQAHWIGNGGIYRTSNQGIDWHQIADKTDFGNDIYTIIFKIVIDPINPKILYAATSKGIYRTLDCEVSAPIWEPVFNNFVYDLELKPGQNSTLYASAYVMNPDGTGFWKIIKSLDYGYSWNPLTEQPYILPIAHVKDQYITLEVSKVKPEFLFCLVRDYKENDYHPNPPIINPDNHLYYCDLATTGHWEIITSYDMEGDFGGGHAFGVEQVTPGSQIIYSIDKTIGGINVGGTSFSTGSPVHVDVEDVIYHPYNASEVWICTHGGVEKSLNGGLNWQAKYEGLGIAMVEQMATSYTDPGLILMGLYHDGVQLTKTPYQKDWNPDWDFLQGFMVDGMLPLIDNKNPQHMWGSGQKGMWNYSSDGFEHSQQISSMKTALWETRGVLNKQNPSVFFRNKIFTNTTTIEEVYRSSNRGLSNGENIFVSNFRNMLPGSTEINITGFKTPFNNGNYLLAWLYNKVPGNSNAVYHLFRTTNANAPANNVNWQELEIPRADWISGVEFDPDNPNIVYLSYSNSTNSNDSQQMIYRINYTNPASAVITDITNNLPVTFSYDNSIATQKGSSGAIYFATEFGIFYTDNYASNDNKWKLVGTGLPNVIPHGLELNYVSNTLRVGTYGRGVWEIDLPCLVTLLLQPILITQNTTWDSYMRLDRSVKVCNMATLTITQDARIAMPASCKIIVEQGGKLIVNGGVLTSGCDSQWQGIEVWGNSAQHQWPDVNGNYMQGYVELNNAIIENAYEALNLWNPSYHTQTGGIVIANNTVFRNNRESVHALEYTNHHPISGKPMDYQAIFTNCTFDITDGYNPTNVFYKHVDLNKVNGVRFNGCGFSLSPDAQGISNYNQAIASYSSGFKVNAICGSTQTPCPETEYKKCTFTGFRTAIYAGNGSLSTNTFYVNRAEFNNNSIGIDVNGVNNPIIINSNFYLSKNQYDYESCSYGIYMNSSTGFAIEDNTFSKAIGAPLADYFGIAVINCPVHSDIYKNTFTGLSAGNYSYGNSYSGSTPFRGLTYSCNLNEDNYADFYVTGNPDPNTKRYGIQFLQGSEFLPAGNTFSRNAEIHIHNDEVNLIDYFYCSTCPNQTPDRDKIGYVSLHSETVSNLCPSHYGGNNGQEVAMNAQQKLDKEIAYTNASTNYQNVESLYNSLKDGGDTETKVSEISNANPEDMWSLREELLGISPHLSDVVLKKVADKTDVFTESAIFDILAANPDELKKEDLIKYLEEKDIPLPEYMIDILRQVASGISYKTVLLQEMAAYSHEKAQSANDMIRSILNEEEPDIVQLRNWLDNLGGIESDKQIISTYIQENDFISAFSLANLLPQLYNLQGNALVEYNQYMDMLQLEQTLHNEDRRMDNLTPIEQEMLAEFAQSSEGYAGVQAVSILETYYDQQFNNCKSLSDGELSFKNQTINTNLLGEAYGLSITVKPNPAKDFAAFDYVLPNQQSSAILEISDVTSSRLISFNLYGNKGQKLWDTRNIPAGTYIYTLKASGYTKSGKLVILNN